MLFRFITTKPGKRHGPSIKNPRVYEALRRQGMSKAQAAAISNAQRRKALPIRLKAPNYGARAGQTIAGRLVRGGDGKFASSGAAAPKRGRKPAKTDEQRAAEREQRRAEREQQRLAKRAENITTTFDALDLAEDAADSLQRLAAGEVVDDDGGLVKMGLAEQAKDGSYRLTATGRAVMNAAERGDIGAARDAKSRAADRASTAAEQAAAAEVAPKPAGGGGGGKKKPPKPPKLPARQTSQAPKPVAGGGGAPKPPAERTEAQPMTDPALADLAQRLSAGETLTDDEQQTLIRNGLARMVRGELVLTQAGSRATRGKATKALRVVEHGGDTIQGNSTAHEAYGHARTYGEISQQWLGMLLDRDWAYAIDNGYALREPGEIVAKEPAFQAQLDDIRARNRPDFKSFAVYKDARGRLRWVAYSSNAYRDRDEEIVSTKALLDDCARADADAAYGPLRWWHVPGWELGDCDFNAMHGRVLVESGTFTSDVIGQAVARKAADLQLSIGFTHAPDEPDRAGVFHHIRRFERSLVPGGRAANPFTRLIVRKTHMDQEKEQALKAVLGDGAAAEVLAGAEAVQKDADDRQTAYKSSDPWLAVGLAVKAAMQAEAAPEPEPEPVAEKAPPPMVEEAVEEVVEEPLIEEQALDEGGGEMSADEFLAQIGALIDAKLAPIAGLLDIEKKVAGHVASLMQPYQAQKDATDAEKAAEIAALKERLAALEGDQPSAWKAPWGGYRATEDDATTTTKAQAEALGLPALDDDAEWTKLRDGLFGKPTMNGVAG